MNPSSKSRISSMAYYSTLLWTVFCFVGTWFIFLKYGILNNGLIAIVLILLFVFTLWSVPFLGLILLSFYVSPTEDSLATLSFRDLLKKAVNGGAGSSKRAGDFPGQAL